MESTPKRPRLGRPPGPRDQVRPNRVVTFVTDQELLLLRAGADARHSSLSRHLHDLLTSKLRTDDETVGANLSGEVDDRS